MRSASNPADVFPPTSGRFHTPSPLRMRENLSEKGLSFISLSHSDNQSESAAKFYNSFRVDVGGHVMTLT